MFKEPDSEREGLSTKAAATASVKLQRSEVVHEEPAVVCLCVLLRLLWLLLIYEQVLLNGSELLESHVTMSVWTYPSPAAVDYAKLRFSYIEHWLIVYCLKFALLRLNSKHMCLGRRNTLGSCRPTWDLLRCHTRPSRHPDLNTVHG